MYSNRNILDTNSPNSLFTHSTFPTTSFTPVLSSTSSFWLGSASTTGEQPCSIKLAHVQPMPREFPLNEHVVSSDLNYWGSQQMTSTREILSCSVNEEKNLSQFPAASSSPIMRKIPFRKLLAAYWVLYKKKMPGVHGLPKELKKFASLKEFASSNNVIPNSISYHIKNIKQKSEPELLEIINTPCRDKRPRLEMNNFSLNAAQSHAPLLKKIWMSRYALEHHRDQG